MAASSNATKTDRSFVEQWMSAPFHAAGMLDPRLVTSGYGAYRRAGATPWPAAATLDALRGRTGAAPGTAAASGDFSTASGNVTIPAGSTAALISIRIKADTVVEATETFTVGLSGAVGAVIDRPTGTGSILTDD